MAVSTTVQAQPQPPLDVDALANLFLVELDKRKMAVEMFDPEATLHVAITHGELKEEHHTGRDAARKRLLHLHTVYDFALEPRQVFHEHPRQVKVLLKGVACVGTRPAYSYTQGFILTQQKQQWLIIKVQMEFTPPPTAHAALHSSQQPADVAWTVHSAPQLQCNQPASGQRREEKGHQRRRRLDQAEGAVRDKGKRQRQLQQQVSALAWWHHTVLLLLLHCWSFGRLCATDFLVWQVPKHA